MKSIYRIPCLVLLGLVCTTPTMAQDEVETEDKVVSTLDTGTFDREVRPQDDLYEFVNGTWLKNTPIPSDKTNYGSFTKLADMSEERLKTIVEELSNSEYPKGTNEQKVGDFFKAFMDVEKANELGATPISVELQDLDKIETKEDLIRHFGWLDKMGVGTPFGAYISQDAKVSTQYIVHLVQSGTTLPDRDYYLVRHEAKNISARNAFVNYINQLNRLTRCLLYTSPSPRDRTRSRMPSSA